MAEGMQRLESLAAAGQIRSSGAPTLDGICAVTAIDYLNFRFADAPWLPAMPALNAMSTSLRERPSVAQTMPFVAS
jgi:glutathione S-transferase